MQSIQNFLLLFETIPNSSTSSLNFQLLLLLLLLGTIFLGLSRHFPKLRYSSKPQLTEQMNRNAAKGSELIREFDKTRSLATISRLKVVRGWLVSRGRASRWGEGRERERETKEEKQGRRGGGGEETRLKSFRSCCLGVIGSRGVRVVFRMRWLQLVATLYSNVGRQHSRGNQDSR